MKPPHSSPSQGTQLEDSHGTTVYITHTHTPLNVTVQDERRQADTLSETLTLLRRNEERHNNLISTLKRSANNMPRLNLKGTPPMPNSEDLHVPGLTMGPQADP